MTGTTRKPIGERVQEQTQVVTSVESDSTSESTDQTKAKAASAMMAKKQAQQSEANKPAPVAEVPAPIVDAVKPKVEEPKPEVEAPKPVEAQSSESAPTPAPEAQPSGEKVEDKPAVEAPKAVVEAAKSEQPAPTVDAQAPVQEEAPPKAEAPKEPEKPAEPDVQKQALAALKTLSAASAGDVAKAVGSAHYKPAALAELRTQGKAAVTQKDYVSALALTQELMTLVAKVIDFDERIAALPAEVDQLTGKQLKDNLTKWIAEHKTASWAEQQQTSGTKGLPALEARLIDYRAREEAARNAKAHSKAALGAAQSEGRIAANGTILEKRAPNSFADEEKTAIEDAIAALGGGPRNWTGKWGVAHGNYQGNLPGVPGAGSYSEYYVRKGPGHAAPGPRRIVRNSKGRCFYSWTHYGESGKPAFVVLDGV